MGNGHAPNLTYAIIEGAQPAEKPYRIHDAKLPGLFLRVQPSGVKSWNQYDLIDESLLQQLQHEREIAEQQRQRAEQARQQAREQRQQQQTTNGGGGGGRGSLDVNVTVKDDRGGAASLVQATKDRQLAQELARNIIPAIEDLVRRGFPFRI